MTTLYNVYTMARKENDYTVTEVAHNIQAPEAEALQNELKNDDS